ncbi:hypothetical protein DUNSADRAFT_14413 [Dunaliella salina]|uniref:HYDIN/VesB/CFA65-like Ig-like domain-containing protein n=1 Tax=Dunaliella salina TaxID=3046 RepID=A0ABQ7H9G7_DUNSA|nr:hypothetical protein DUNSADRAFT_14413 [Dunaliella salina]|eukprot:KAF5843497.1 hypothetical protein DUNSADRAFT_14413 [Dunaliella salina]
MPQVLSCVCTSTAPLQIKFPGTPVNDETSIQFPATPVNDETSVSVVLYNTSGTPQAFEFGVPPDSGLKFHPHVGEVPAGGSLRIQIDYAPLPDEEPEEESEEEEQKLPPQPPAKPGTKAQPPPPLPSPPSPPEKSQKPKLIKKKSKRMGRMLAVDEGEEQERGSTPPKDGEGDDAVAQPDQDSNAWYRWQQHSIPCFIRPPDYTPEASAIPSTTAKLAGTLQGSPGGLKSSEGTATAGGKGGAGRSKSVQALHLAVTTCAVQPDIILRSDLNWIEDKRCYELDFGPVPVGQRVTRSIELLNQGTEPAPLKALPLDHRELFAVVNAWRLLKSGGRFRSLLAFTPQHRASYLEMLTISSDRTRIRLALKGQGISPELRLEPATLTTTGLDLGDVYKNESAQATFSVINVCPFPLSFSMKFNGIPNHNLQNRPAFFCRPSEGTLAQGEKCEVTLVFRPSGQRPYFQDMLQVHVPNQHDQLIIPVKVCVKKRGEEMVMSV